MKNTDLTRMRRRDRAVTDEAWIRAALRQAATRVLAIVAEGQPFLNSNPFVYDEEAHAIYRHTAKLALTLRHTSIPRSSLSSKGHLAPGELTRWTRQQDGECRTDWRL